MNNKAYNYFNWLFIRPWCFWVPIIEFISALLIGYMFPNYSDAVYKISGTLMQCIGVIVFIYVLNLNIAFLKNTSLLNDLINWLQDIPRDRSVTYEMESGVESKVSVSDHVKATIIQGVLTIEERIGKLEGEVKQIRQMVINGKKELVDIINKKENEFNKKFENVNVDLINIKEKIESTIIGDYRWNIFSVLQILFGLYLMLI